MIECLEQTRFQLFRNFDIPADISVEYHLVHVDEYLSKSSCNFSKILSPFRVLTDFSAYSSIDCDVLSFPSLHRLLEKCKKHSALIQIELRKQFAVIYDFKNHRIDVFQTSEHFASVAGGRMGPGSFACFLQDFGATLLHSSCVDYSGRAAVFLAMDEGGKTTAARLCDKGTVVADDQTLFKKDGKGRWLAYGTPWTTFTPHPAPTVPCAIFLLEKAESFSLNPLGSLELLASLWNEHSTLSYILPSNKREAMFDIYSNLATSVPAYLLKFSKDYIDQEAILKCLDR